jgi:hypothetical protein
MVRELDTVVLTRDIAEHGLREGDVGAVAHCYSSGSAFEVEFVTADGQTIALLTLEPADVRPILQGKILHVRAVTHV